ncbi:MAG TPA: restriction endonuclease subunit S [Candidatus Cryosericum sp.]
MPRVTVACVFEFSPGNHGLTEKAIRDQPPSVDEQGVPVLSGRSDNERPQAWIRHGATTVNGQLVKYYEGPCLVLSKDGSAGLLTFQGRGAFTLNHHACVLSLRPEWSGRVDLQWFAWQYRNYFVRWTTSKSDNRVLTKEAINSAEIELPDIGVQMSQLARLQVLLLVASKLRALILLLQELLDESPGSLAADDQSVPLNIVFDARGGLQGLTEDYIYHHTPSTGQPGLDVVTSAAGAISSFGRISQEAASALARQSSCQEFVFHGPALVVARNGKAGLVSVVEQSSFVMSDHAYVLLPRPDYVNKIDPYWFAHNFSRAFLDSSTSKSDNGTFTKLKLQDLAARILPLCEQQRIGNRIKDATVLEHNAMELLDSIGDLISRRIS